MVIDAQRGGIIVAVSRELADLARAASVGLSDADVQERTKLSFASWRRLWRGEVLSDSLLLKFAAGLNLDTQEVLAGGRGEGEGCRAVA